MKSFGKKRLSSVAIILAAALAMTAGCLGPADGDGGKLSVVCTVFPQYDWVREILGEDGAERFELTLLIGSRIDLHSYSPSVGDIAKVKTCDVFIHVGGASDVWVEGILRDANPDMAVINLMDTLGDDVLMMGHDHDECDCECLCGDGAHGHDDGPEGCDPDCGCDAGHGHDDGDAHDGHDRDCDCGGVGHGHGEGDGEDGADEHVWLSLRHAMALCRAIAATLSEVDPDGADAYAANLEGYLGRLEALDSEYAASVGSAKARALVFADRFPFLYMFADYGLGHEAAFKGCSAETEASFSVIASLAGAVDRLGLRYVMVTESSDQSIARTVVSEAAGTGRKILVLDSMQSVTSDDVAKGMTYLSIMERNLAVLMEALS